MNPYQPGEDNQDPYMVGYKAGAASRDAEIAELVSLLDAINEHMNVPGWCEFSTNEDAMNYHKTADRLEKALTIATEPKNETI